MIEKGDFDIDRIVTPKETQAETTDDFEVSLRPKTLDEYIGCLLYTSDAADD